MKNLRIYKFSTKEPHLMSTCLKNPGEEHQGLFNFQNEIWRLSTVAMKIKSC